MNTLALFILSVINIFAELTELAYDLGAATRKYVVPAVIATYVAIDHYGNKGLDYLTTSEFSVKFRNTPLLTGFAFGSRYKLA